MPQDPIRRSGEIRVEQTLGEMLGAIHASVEKRLDNIVERFENHAERVNTRLSEGDKTMALMNQSIRGVENQLTTIRSDMKEQSDKLDDVENKRRASDKTPRATPALEPKVEQSWINKALKKGAETAVATLMTTVVLGVFLWVVRGNAAKIIDPPSTVAPSPIGPP